jgi:acetyl-CoA carboxylase carboxyl transferase subunit alpha
MALHYYLDFEKPIAELEEKIQELVEFSTETVYLKTEIARLEKKVQKMREEIFSNLTRWQTVQVARHINRPFTLDYIRLIFTDFIELHGDRKFADDHAIVAGLARLDGQRSW